MTARRPPPLHPLPDSGEVIVAFSGGPDSVCLLHALLERYGRERLRCVHIDHGLDSGSPARAKRAAELAGQAGTTCDALSIEVEPGDGIEAAARQARYGALAGCMDPGDVLVTAHHADDQVETILLRLLRGAGPEGLSGIPQQRAFADGWLIRPMLDWTRSDIEAFLAERGLDSIQDPANDLPDFDRNQVRHRLLPLIRERWPGADEAILRSARLCRGAARFIAGRASIDLEQALDGSHSIRLDRLAGDETWYRGEILRRWCLRLGWAPPPGRQLEAFAEQLSKVDADRVPELRWKHHCIRFWRQRLWAENESAIPDDWHLTWDGAASLELPCDLGWLLLAGPSGPPLRLSVTSGRPGERLRPGQGPSRPVKQLLAEADVPPWQRNAWPRIRSEGRLVAVGDRWLEADFAAVLEQRGQRLVWRRDDSDVTDAAVESNV
jgi:tRNA(Ile)-lysidine synthase